MTFSSSLIKLRYKFCKINVLLTICLKPIKNILALISITVTSNVKIRTNFLEKNRNKKQTRKNNNKKLVYPLF